MKSFYFSRRARQSGFTLVEIAIVLVIVGLLLAGVLKGQELIENSRIKNIAKDMDTMAAAVNAYQDRYRGIPGDSATATTHTENGWGTTAFTAGNNNGQIGAANTTFTVGANENTMAMVSLMYAGFITGNPAAGAPAAIIRPQHAGGGQLALSSSVFGFTGRNVVCVNNLTGKYAGALDRLLDDGDPTSGSVRANRIALPGNPAATAPAAGTQYQEDTASNAVPVTLCRQL
ncbi:MAG: type II secretion system protein [Ramlibacter sp.]|nr:type II secretion system protein [Ramlibacter sp.]MCW5650917.1 type II secretion system protein [Ramlibacter sp.]